VARAAGAREADDDPDVLYSHFLLVPCRYATASFLVRPKAAVLALEHVRAVLTKDAIVLHVPSGERENSEEESRRHILGQHAEVSGTLAHRARALPDQLLPRLEAAAARGSAEPLAAQVLDACLLSVVEWLEHDLTVRLEPSLRELLLTLRDTQSPSQLRRLMEASNSLDVVTARVSAVRACLAETLADDADMQALLALTANVDEVDGENDATRDSGANEHAEWLLENFVHTLDELDSRCDDLRHRIANTQAFIQVHFDSQRNRLMRMNLVLSGGAFSASCAAAVASVFGMNLEIGLAANESAFTYVCTAIGAMAASIFAGFYVYYSRTKYLPDSSTQFRIASRYYKWRYPELVARKRTME
jgi:magnesium transporter